MIGDTHAMLADRLHDIGEDHAERVAPTATVIRASAEPVIRIGRATDVEAGRRPRYERVRHHADGPEQYPPPRALGLLTPQVVTPEMLWLEEEG